ncbi:hypothetical protein FJZ18_00395 [Candidatus Pacearchaeota archaeon]|nr:hypothetical protein [Candidatus Pacearchaeota archaeon]
MGKVDSWAVVTGVVFVVIGALLLLLSFLFIPALIYAIIALAIGIAILVTLKEQDAIEPIKEKRIKRRNNR